MEDSVQVVDRLLGALEALLEQESVLLSDQSWAELNAVQDRAAVIALSLTERIQSSDFRKQNNREVRGRVDRILTRQSAKLAKIGSDLAQVDVELKALHASEVKVRKFAPTYQPKSGETTPLAFAGEA